MTSFGIRYLCIIFCFLSATVSHAQARDTTAILLFGDSIVAGYGLNTEHSLAVLVENALRARGHVVQVIDGGVSGDTTGGGRSRLQWMLDKYAPDIAVLALGGNDVLRGIPPDVTRDNVEAMLTLLRARDVRTILSAVQAPDTLGAAYQAKFDAIYPELAKQYQVPLYPFLLKETFHDPALMQADGIHPNAAGAQVVANALADYLSGTLNIHSN